MKLGRGFIIRHKFIITASGCHQYGILHWMTTVYAFSPHRQDSVKSSILVTKISFHPSEQCPWSPDKMESLIKRKKAPRKKGHKPSSVATALRARAGATSPVSRDWLMGVCGWKQGKANARLFSRFHRAWGSHPPADLREHSATNRGTRKACAWSAVPRHSPWQAVIISHWFLWAFYFQEHREFYTQQRL